MNDRDAAMSLLMPPVVVRRNEDGTFSAELEPVAKQRRQFVRYLRDYARTLRRIAADDPRKYPHNGHTADQLELIAIHFAKGAKK